MVKKLLFLSICLALCSAYVWAGDPADANNPDTVYMDNVPYVRALQSNIAVSVNFFNDEELIGVEIPLIWHNPNNLGIYLDSISYVDSRVAEFGLKSSVNSPLEIDNVNHKVILWCLPTGFDGEPPTIVPGTGLFATLYFHTDDTWDKYAPVTIDTFSNANHALMFTINQMWPIVSFTPIFKGGIVTEVHEVPSAEVP
ncbi:MAG: hypothetical protein MUO85_08265, partial [candidate division Zixibacteria bacterium]|nr:hypothetical protein [candidate division Zixibacteria bacterium]